MKMLKRRNEGEMKNDGEGRRMAAILASLSK